MWPGAKLNTRLTINTDPNLYSNPNPNRHRRPVLTLLSFYMANALLSSSTGNTSNCIYRTQSNRLGVDVIYSRYEQHYSTVSKNISVGWRDHISMPVIHWSHTIWLISLIGDFSLLNFNHRSVILITCCEHLSVLLLRWHVAVADITVAWCVALVGYTVWHSTEQRQFNRISVWCKMWRSVICSWLCNA